MSTLFLLSASNVPDTVCGYMATVAGTLPQGSSLAPLCGEVIGQMQLLKSRTQIGPGANLVNVAIAGGALTTAAASLTGAPQTSATAAAAAATSTVTSTWVTGGEIAAITPILTQIAAGLSAGAALTACQAAQSAIAGLFS